MKKVIISFLILFTSVLSIQAKSVNRDFSGVIKDSGVDKEAVTVSIKEADSGKVVYSLNDMILFHPASVQKIITMPVAADILGSDYKFSTKLYKRGSGKYVVELGADPFLTSGDLKALTSKVETGVNHIYIDDSILDKKTWGEGWQWDDDLNILMPKFGSYNLDNNLVKVTIMPSQDGRNATIVNSSKYPFVFLSSVITGSTTDIKVSRENSISANTINFSGTVSRPTSIYIPINNLQRYFYIKLNQSLENNKIYLAENFTVDKVRANDLKVTEINHDLSSALDEIIKNSNNLMAETVFKLSGGKYINSKGNSAGVKHSGTDSDAIKAFDNYCKKNNLDNSRVRIVDGSGVSKNNLLSADFITEFLVLNKKNSVMDRLPQPGEGTLTHRMLPLKDNLRAKTGTLSDISSIAGYLTSKSGNKYVFCIMINDMKLSPSDKKVLEDYIIREAYLRL